jgi:hypothetical protein
MDVVTSATLSLPSHACADHRTPPGIGEVWDIAEPTTRRRQI